MADYKGGGGGASVVPASQVVASDREDQKLTQAGLVAAIAALPAGGGDIYIGAGTLAITSPITVNKDVRLFGAGPEATFLDVDSSIVCFSVGDFSLEINDIGALGDGSAGQIFIQATASSSKRTVLNNVVIPTVGFGDAFRVFFDADNFNRDLLIEGCIINVSDTGSFILDGASVIPFQMSDSNVIVNGDVTIPQDALITTSFITGTTIVSGAKSKFTSCEFSGTLTASTGSLFSACEFNSAITAAAGAVFTGSLMLAAITASGSNVQVVSCTLLSFTSATAGVDGHILKGNVFTGVGNNVTLTDSDDCIVKENISCQVNETATSNNNRFANISTSSTIIGSTSVVEDAQKFVFTSPGVLTTTDNDLFARLPVQVTTPVRLLSIEVQTAPTGASVLVAFRIGTRSTGALAAAFATLTLPAGSFTASTTVAGITIAATEFLTVEITQVGSGVPGSSATIVARG